MTTRALTISFLLATGCDHEATQAASNELACEIVPPVDTDTDTDADADPEQAARHLWWPWFPWDRGEETDQPDEDEDEDEVAAVYAPTRVQLFVGAPSPSSPVRIQGTAWREDGMAIESVTLLGRQVRALNPDFSSFELVLEGVDLQAAAVYGVVTVRPWVKDACHPGGRLLPCDDPEGGNCAWDRDPGEVGPCTCVSFAVGPDDPSLDDVDVTSRVGSVYDVPLTGGRFAAPTLLGPLLDQLAPDWSLLIAVVGYDAITSRADLRLALAWRGQQAAGLSTIELSGDAGATLADNPRFALGPGTVEAAVRGGTVVLGELTARGWLSGDGDHIDIATLEATVDTTGLPTYLGSSVCDLLAADGVPDCAPCPGGDGATAACFELRMKDLAGVRVDRRVVAVE